VKDEGSPVVARSCGSGVLEPIDRPLDLVAALADVAVETGGQAALAAASFAVGPLVLRLGDGVLDPASSQVATIAA
jgi:hypothetical protein